MTRTRKVQVNISFSITQLIVSILQVDVRKYESCCFVLKIIGAKERFPQGWIG